MDRVTISDYLLIAEGEEEIYHLSCGSGIFFSGTARVKPLPQAEEMVNDCDA
jgi:hypothetical protein